MALSLTNLAQTVVQYTKIGIEASTMAVSLGINGTTAAVSFVAWILLAVYFGAQKKAAA